MADIPNEREQGLPGTMIVNGATDAAGLSTGPGIDAGSVDIATPNGRKRLHRIELGVTGTPVFAGRVMQDPNADLQFPASAAIYDMMRRSDGQVKAALSAVILPILALEWSVVPYQADGPDGPDDEKLPATPEAVEQAEHVRKALLQGLDTPWKAILREILQMLAFGFWVVEPIFEVREDGKIHLKKLATRLPTSIDRFHFNRAGELVSITQRAVNPADGTTETIVIDAADIIVFTHDKEGADVTGIAMIRPAYKHYFMKDWLYRIGVINTERGGGFPVITTPPDADDADLRAARAVGESLHLHEKAYVLEVDGYKFRLEGTSTGRIGDVMTQVDHHDTKILTACLAQFLQFGTQAGGSGTGRAMTGDVIDVFMMAIESVIGEVEDVVNRRLITKWCDYNWRVQGGYPQLKAQNVRGMRIRAAAALLATLVNGKILTPDDKLEAFVRKSLDLPEADPETAREVGGTGGDPLAALFGGPGGGGDGEDLPEPAPARGTGNPEDEDEAELSEFATVQADVGGQIAGALAAFRGSIDPADLDDKGLEREPHVTVRYGLHATAAAPVAQALRGKGPAKLRLGRIARFQQADRDVLVVRVDSRDFKRLNRELGKLPHTQAYRYSPHLTLAYLKKGAGTKYVGDKRFDGTALTVDRLTFRPKGGGARTVVPLTDTTIQELREPGWGTDPLWVRRELTTLERCVALEDIDRTTKRAALEMIERIRPIQDKQIDAVAKIARRELDGVTEVKVPFVGILANAVKGLLKEVFDYGRQQVVAELQRQASDRQSQVPMTITLAEGISNRRGAFDFFSAKADILSRRWSNRLQDAAVTAKLRAVRDGLDEAATEEDVREALEVLSDKASRAMVYQTIAEAFALGRKVEAENQRERIGQVQRSGVLDGNICGHCKELDGSIGDLDDPALAVPDSECSGETYGNSCRCILVYQLIEG